MKRKLLSKLCLGSLAVLGSLNLFGQVTTATEDFNNNQVPSGFRAGQGFFLTAADQRLKVKVGKQQWEEFSYDGNFDLSASPRVSFKIRGDYYFQFVLAFVSVDGDVIRDNRFPDPLIASIFPTKEFIDVSYDMTGLLREVNPAKVTSIRFMVDPACEKSVNIEIDDFRVGAAAINYPRLIAPITQNVYANSTQKTVLLRGVTAGSTITATSSNTGIIPNPSVTAVGSNGIANLTFTPVANASGDVVVTLRVSRAGMQDLVFPFDVQVRANQAPLIDPVAALTMGANASLSVPLTGISDGNTERVQNITITATSSDQSILRDADLTVDYSNPFTNGKLNIKTLALASGSRDVNITLTLKDDAGTSAGGVDTKTIVIPLKVFAVYYKSPEIAPISSNNFAFIGTNYTVTLTGINDGNGGNRVASVTATSSNTAAADNPIVNYTLGSNTATITYSLKNKQSSTISINVTNSGAPANSNGNTTTTKTFTVKGVDPALTGYVETFQSFSGDGSAVTPNILGADYYSSGTGGDDRVTWMTNLDDLQQKWFVEGQGAENTLTLNPSSNNATLAVNKPSSVPRTFAGIWFSPRKLFNLSNNKYLSLTISANRNTRVTFDIFDVNNKRYGLLPEQNVSTTPRTITFVFDKAPQDASFDFSKVAAVLINSLVFQAFQGTFTISNLKIGDRADNAPAANPAEILMAPIANRTILRDSKGMDVLLEKIFVVKDAINQSTPVILSVSSSNTALIPTPTVTSVTDGKAKIQLLPTAGATGTSTITVSTKASGVPDKNFTFTVNVLDKSTLSPGTLTLNANQTFQTIAGIGQEVGNPKDAEERVADQACSMLRFDIGAEYQPGLEGDVNDNSDPFVMDLSKYKFSADKTEGISKAIALGCKRIIGCVWTPPMWMKGVFAHRPQTQLGTRNSLLPEMYDEFAEYIVGSCLAFRNTFGIDLYSICLQNEAEFYASSNYTATCGYTAEQAAEVVRRTQPRLRAAGLTTHIHGFDQLPVQGNVLTWFRLFNNSDVRDKFNEFSIHAYGENAIDPANLDDQTLRDYYTEAQRVDPKKELWMTETSGWEGETANVPNAAVGQRAISSIFSSLANNLSAWVYLSVRKEVPSMVMNYYVHKNFQLFVRPGAVRIGTSTNGLAGLAFKNDVESTYTVVLANTGTEPRAMRLAGLPSNFPQKMYAYMTAENINCQFIDEVTNTDGYMVYLPPNSMVSLYSKYQDVTSNEDEVSLAAMEINVYPNPNKGNFNVSLPSSKFTRIEVLDLTGRMVLSQEVRNNHENVPVSLEGLQQGMYIINAKGAAAGTLRKKVMIE